MNGAKQELRRHLIKARRETAETTRAQEAAALTASLSAALTADDVVCAYVPVGSEPGSIALLDTVHQAVRRVLLPLARQGDDGDPAPLSWAEYRPGGLISAPMSLREPAGPALPPETLATATVVLVPALAADRHGVRLGRGAGYYDRSLHLAGPGTRLIVVVRDAELFDELPAEPHDVRMTHVLTPGDGIVAVR